MQKKTKKKTSFKSYQFNSDYQDIPKIKTNLGN